MKEKTLTTEHQKLFTKIDNLLEEQVLRYEMNPNKDSKIARQIGKDL